LDARLLVPAGDAVVSYDGALKQARKVGAANADDAGAMALFCDGVLQILVGAVSPKLVWEGAQAKGMSALELHDLCHSHPSAVYDLMWEV
jgi:hypothetical protein